MTDQPKTFEEYELIGRKKFTNDYQKYFQRIEAETDQYSNFDLMATGYTKRVYKIEIKVRGDNYSIYQYSGRSWIEKVKIEYFRLQYKENPNIICLYVVYFNDGCCIYDMTGRIAVGSSEVLHIFMVGGMPSSTAGQSYSRQKLVGQLALNPVEYQDKLYVSKPVIRTNPKEITLN